MVINECVELHTDVSQFVRAKHPPVERFDTVDQLLAFISLIHSILY